MPAKRAYGVDQDFYPWSPIVNRPVLRWPEDARVALAVIVNLEHWIGKCRPVRRWRPARWAAPRGCGADPLVFEVKAGTKLNQRGKRQLAKLQHLHSFLETDSASDFRGLKGPCKRVELDVAPRDNLQALNDCIAHAQRDGQCVIQPELGVTYAAICGKPDYHAILSKLVGRANAVFILNAEKNDHAWAPYMPFVASIRAEEHLLDFIEGRLCLIVLIDAQVLCDTMSSEEWAVRYRPDHPYVIQCLHRPLSVFRVSSALARLTSSPLLPGSARLIAPRWSV